MSGPAAALLRGLDRAVGLALLALLAALVAIGGLQIVFRFVLGNPLPWVLEASVLGMVWATMLSGYVGVRQNRHLSADFVGLRLSPRRRWVLDLVAMLLCLVFLAVYGWSSLAVVDAMDGIPFTSLPVEQPALYWSLPVGALLMALAFAVRLREHAASRPR